jgi:DNA-binding transcriptional MocR family regulator
MSPFIGVNGYIVTMTNWTPELESRSGPRYQAIADALAADVSEGRLKAGARLPTHRDLAWKVGVTVGTISRAYAEAERRGLVYGEVGRGTFVRERTPSAPPHPGLGRRDGFVELAYNLPPLGVATAAVAKAMAEVARSPDLQAVMGYSFDTGQPAHRAAVASWIARFGVPAEADSVALTSGAQNATLLSMMGLAGPGAAVLTEELTFYGIKSVAAQLGLRLYGVGLDAHGLVPEALDAACRSSGAKVLYCIPTLQNPTASVMPEERRREIVEVCRRHEVVIVEDDVYGFLPETLPPPLAALAPERTAYLGSLSKFGAPGLRLGWVWAAPDLLRPIAEALRAASLMTSPILAEIGARLIRDGEVQRLAEWQRAEARRRQEIAAGILAGQTVSSHPESFHLWLELPEPWRREVFAAEARGRGVGVASAEVFAAGRQPVPHAARLCLQAPESVDDLTRGLSTLSDMLAGQPPGGPAMV